MPLRLDQVYSIVNTATRYPLLHVDNRGTNITHLNHWWKFVHISDNVYHLTIQDVTLSKIAPRWGKDIRLIKVGPDTYHMLPVLCYIFRKMPPHDPNEHIYVDYFDNNGRDQSECVNRTRVEGDGFVTNLTNEGVHTKPREILNKANFLYRITPIGDRIIERVKSEQFSNGGRVEFSASIEKEKSAGESLILPEVEIRESWDKDDDKAENDEVSTLKFVCSAKQNIVLDRTLWSFVVLKDTKFRLDWVLRERNDSEATGGRLSIEGSLMGDRIGKLVHLSRSEWTLESDISSDDYYSYDAPIDTFYIDELPTLGNTQGHNSSRNYFYYANDTNRVKFHYTDNAARIEIRLGNGASPPGDFITCERVYEGCFRNEVVFLGHRIEKQCMMMMVMLILIWCALITYLIRRRRQRNWGYFGNHDGIIIASLSKPDGKSEKNFKFVAGKQIMSYNQF